MPLPHPGQKAERVTLTLVPTADDRSFPSLPSTFNTLHRSYEWRHAAEINYMLVPRKISSNEILVDLFLSFRKKEKTPRAVQRVAQAFVEEKMQSEWKGLKLGKIGRPTMASPPHQVYVRGTIEEILGASLKV